MRRAFAGTAFVVLLAMLLASCGGGASDDGISTRLTCERLTNAGRVVRDQPKINPGRQNERVVQRFFADTAERLADRTRDTELGEAVRTIGEGFRAAAAGDEASVDMNEYQRAGEVVADVCSPYR